MSVERLKALHPLDADDPRATYLINKPGRVELCTRTGYRAFAVWFEAGTQPGLHVRGEHGTPSTQFRGRNANWVYLGPGVDWAVATQTIRAARDIARQRGGGRSHVGNEVYQPLEKALKLLEERPERLGAGGPRAKVLSGETEVCAALATLAAEWIAKLDAAAAKACAVDATGARRVGAMSCKRPASNALVRAMTVLVAKRQADATAFAVECDELVMRHEFDAAFVKFKAGEVPKYERMLWRGADAKKFPAFWLVRLTREKYGLLAKLGGRWGWHVGDRDSALASVPEALFDQAVEMVMARDRSRSTAPA